MRGAPGMLPSPLRNLCEWEENAMPDEKNRADESERDRQAYADVVARYYGDPEFKAKVDANPTETLKAAGIAAPEGAKIKPLFDTRKRMHVVVPLPRNRASDAG